MARRSEHTQEQIREMVLKAAESIVIEEGFHALTVRKVAMEIGYTVGSIYMVFANMNDLIMHVKGRTLDELADELHHAKPGDSVEGHIQAMADTYLKFAHKHYNRWRMIFDALNDEAIPAWYQQKIDRMLAIVEERCKQLLPGQSQEKIHLATRSLWGGVHGVCVLSLNGSLGRVGVKSAQASVQMLVDNFIQGWKQSAHRADAAPPNK